MTRRALLSGIGFAGLAAAKNWDKAVLPDWNAKTVERLLTNSPWARPLDLPLIHRGAHTEIYLTARWSSALPIRQALALDQFGRKGLDSEEARELPAPEPDHRLLEVFGFPATMFPEGTDRLEQDLGRFALVAIPGRKPVETEEVIVPAHGMHISASFRFPRFEAPPDGDIEFRAQSGPIRIAQRFQLRDMHYNGRLEL